MRLVFFNEKNQFEETFLAVLRTLSFELKEKLNRIRHKTAFTTP